MLTTSNDLAAIDAKLRTLTDRAAATPRAVMARAVTASSKTTPGPLGSARATRSPRRTPSPASRCVSASTRAATWRVGEDLAIVRHDQRRPPALTTRQQRGRRLARHPAVRDRDYEPAVPQHAAGRRGSGSGCRAH